MDKEKLKKERIAELKRLSRQAKVDIHDLGKKWGIAAKSVVEYGARQGFYVSISKGLIRNMTARRETRKDHDPCMFEANKNRSIFNKYWNGGVA